MRCDLRRGFLSWVVALLALLTAPALFAQPTATADFHLSLPSGWIKLPPLTSNQFIYRNQSEHRQLTISIFDSQLVVNDATFQRVVELRLIAERQMLQPTDQFEVDDVERSSELRRVRYSVVANTRPPRYATGAIIAIPHRIVTFYVESLGGTRNAHVEASRAILESAQVR